MKIRTQYKVAKALFVLCITSNLLRNWVFGWENHPFIKWEWYWIHINLLILAVAVYLFFNPIIGIIKELAIQHNEPKEAQEEPQIIEYAAGKDITCPECSGFKIVPVDDPQEDGVKGYGPCATCKGVGTVSIKNNKGGTII